MAWVRDDKGRLLQYNDPANAKLMVEKFGATPVSDEDAAQAQATADANAEAAKHPIVSAAEGAFTGAVNAFTGIPRAADALGHMASNALGLNNADTVASGDAAAREMVAKYSTPEELAAYDAQHAKPVQSPTGENVMRAAGNALGGNGDQYVEDVNRRAAQNPLSHGLGSFAGSIAGAGPGMAVGKGVGAAAEAAGAGKGLASFAEGTAFGAPQGIADAAAEAEQKHQELTASQAFAYGGIGALLAGGLSFVGKQAEGLFAARHAAEAAGGGTLEAVPDIATHGGSTEPLNPSSFSDRYGAKLGPPETIQAPEPKPLRQFPVLETPESAAPIGQGRTAGTPEAHADLEMSAAKDPTIEGAASEPMFQRNTRYSKGQRDLPDGLPDTELPLGGAPGSEVHPEELRAALNGEAVNSYHRTQYVKKLLGPVPEGATPEWVMNMSEHERIALADYVGALKYTESGKPIPPSDTTWKAFADAIGEREGFTHEPVPEGAATGPDLTPVDHTTAAEAAAPAVERASATALQPEAPPVGFDAFGNPLNPSLESPSLKSFGQAPSPGMFPTPEPPPTDAFGQPVHPPTLEGPAVKPFGEADHGPPLPPQPEEGKAGFDRFMHGLVKNSARWGLRKGIGAVVGGAAGGMFGPVGYAAGAAGGYLATAALEKLPSMAAKAAKVSAAAVDMAISGAAKTPQSVRLMAGLHTGEALAKLFMGKEKTPEAAYQARTKELQTLQANPGLVSDKVGAAFGSMGHMQQTAITTVTQTTQRGIDYLLQHAPTALPDPTSLTPLASRPTPNRTDITEFQRIYNAVMYPTTVLSDIKNGLVTSDQIDAIKYVHPQWYQENIVNPVLSKMRERDVTGEPFNPSQRRTIDTLLGIQTGVDESKFADHYAPLFTKAVAAQAQPAQQKDDGSSGRALGKRSVIASSYMSPTNKMLGAPQ